MSHHNDKLLVVQGYSPEGDTWLSFREPTETPIADLCKRLVEDRYNKPFLVENRTTRSLCFGINGDVQSEMYLSEPETLVNAYTRKMMGFLLFRRRPRDVIMIGLGGGSLTKYCHRHLPTTRLTIVEIDAGVIALRSHFEIPPDDYRLRVISADGSAYIAQMARTKQSADVLLVDAFDRNGIAASVTTRTFLKDARSALTPYGVFVMNIVADEVSCKRFIKEIRSVFGDPVIAVAVGSGSNVVVFAGRALRNQRRLLAAARYAKHIEGRLGLRFPTLLRKTNEFRSQLQFNEAIG